MHYNISLISNLQLFVWNLISFLVDVLKLESDFQF